MSDGTDGTDSGEPREPQAIQFEGQVSFGRSMDYDEQWLAHFLAQPAPEVQGVDANLYAGDAGGAGTGQDGDTAMA